MSENKEMVRAFLITLSILITKILGVLFNSFYAIMGANARKVSTI